MSTKKRLIGRLALAAGAVLVVAGVVGIAAVARDAHEERVTRETQRRHEEEARQQWKRYLSETAAKITQAPVDPMIVGEIQTKHLEESPETRVFVWAVDLSGGFLFGVPSDAFARLNAAYDKYHDEISREAFYVDRQDFLRRLIAEDGELDFSELESPSPDELGSRSFKRSGEAGRVMSASLRGKNGAALGTLYLKFVESERVGIARTSNVLEVLMGVSGGFSGLSLVFLWFLLPTWVYVDAQERGMRRAVLWAALVLISFFIGLVVYLIARPEHTRVLECPGCGRDANGGAFCPHCGRDLSTAFCPACKYPLKPDWVFCPACRAEIGKRVTAEPAESGASGG
jgi:hypothetical protein